MKKNTVSFVKITSFIERSKAVMSIGFSSFVCSVGMGFMVILFNNQIMRYFGNNELAVYGVAGNIFTLIQTFSYGIGIIAAVFSLLLPTQIVSLYMKVSGEVLAIAPSIFRQYILCLLFVPFNVFATYYLQAVKRVKASVTVSVLRGFILGGIFVYIFPVVFGAGSIWFIMFSVECITVLVAIYLFKSERG